MTFEALHVAAPKLAAAMLQLRQLTITCNCYSTEFESTSERWNQVCGHLRGLLLQNLDLCVRGNGVNTGPELSALLLLTCLPTLLLLDYNTLLSTVDFADLFRG